LRRRSGSSSNQIRKIDHVESSPLNTHQHRTTAMAAQSSLRHHNRVRCSWTLCCLSCFACRLTRATSPLELAHRSMPIFLGFTRICRHGRPMRLRLGTQVGFCGWLSQEARVGGEEYATAHYANPYTQNNSALHRCHHDCLTLTCGIVLVCSNVCG
jgi:hypothetical protein